MKYGANKTIVAITPFHNASPVSLPFSVITIIYYSAEEGGGIVSTVTASIWEGRLASGVHGLHTKSWGEGWYKHTGMGVDLTMLMFLGLLPQV